MGRIYNFPTRTMLMLFLALLAHQAAMASDIIVIGKLVTNEPMDHVNNGCPENEVCLRSWWKSVVRVQRTVEGRPLSGRVTAASMQHAGLSSRFKNAVRLFVLEPIADSDQRAKLRADYYLKEMSEPREMFCLSQTLEGLTLNPEHTYVAGDGDSKRYCFELTPN